MITIPDTVLDAIATHRPHLAGIVRNLRANPDRAVQFEKALADAYLAGEARIPAVDVWRLSACCTGKGFGGTDRD